MNEVKETKKAKLIAFRVTDDEYAQIERIALAVGDKGEAGLRRGAPAARRREDHDDHGDNKNEPGRERDFGATERVPHVSAVSTRRHLKNGDQ